MLSRLKLTDEMTLTIIKASVVSTSCKAHLQKPLRWLMKKAYKLIHGETTEVQNVYLNNEQSKMMKISLSSVQEICLCENEANDGHKLENIESNISGVSCETDEFKTTPPFLDLPVQIRQSIYNLIEARDILTIRLTCKALKHDIESFHGVCIKVHDGRYDFGEMLAKFGIARLTIEQLVHERTCILKHPELLKTLIIIGPVSNENLDILLWSSPNLAEWIVDFQLSDRLISSNAFLKPTSLHHLKILRISCSSAEISRSPSARKTIQDILANVVCPNLRAFHLHIVALMQDLMSHYQIYAQAFIRNNESLRKVDIELTQLSQISTATNDLEDIELAGEWLNTGCEIKILQLSINSNMHLWYPMMDSQTCLRCLVLQMNGVSWNRLILALDRNARTLTDIVISGLCSTSRDGITTVPVDLGLLRNLKVLENLEIQQIDMESRGLESPSVLRTSNLPESLKCVKLHNLRLKPHQAMFLLVKLPLLDELELKCWSDSGETLAAYLTVVTFLIKFDITSVRSLVLISSRRIMENQGYEIDKMRRTLLTSATIIQSNTELHSRLQITR